jgi:hypothetical protein
MHSVTKKIIIGVASLNLLCGAGAACASIAPSIIFKNMNLPNSSATAADLPPAVINYLHEKSLLPKDCSQIAVYQYAKHFVVYFISNAYWGFSKTRLDLDANNTIVNITENYHSNQSEYEMSLTDQPSICPDPSVEFVAISAYPDFGDVSESINRVYQAALKKYHHNVVKILGDEADGQTYKNWLSCPNLKGFYSIGHGNEEEIMVGHHDLVPYYFFLREKQFTNKYQHTTLLFNSCLVYNFPFGSELVFGNVLRQTDHFKPFPGTGPKAYQFIGGVTNLAMNDSERTSACFLEHALNGAPMDYTNFQTCVGIADFYYQDFGISYPGKIIN